MNWKNKHHSNKYRRGRDRNDGRVRKLIWRVVDEFTQAREPFDTMKVRDAVRERTDLSVIYKNVYPVVFSYYTKGNFPDYIIRLKDVVTPSGKESTTIQYVPEEEFPGS